MWPFSLRILPPKESWKCPYHRFRDNQTFQLSDPRPGRTVNPTSAINLICCKSAELRRTGFLARNTLPFARPSQRGFSSTAGGFILSRRSDKMVPDATVSISCCEPVNTFI